MSERPRISVEDLEHHGATKSAVAIRIRANRRRQRRPAGHAALSPGGAEAGMTDATTPGARILVVDDNDDNRYTLTLYLELEGYADIQIAEDGE
jgi:hypothetical protein